MNVFKGNFSARTYLQLPLEAVHKLCRLRGEGGGQKLLILLSKKMTERGGGGQKSSILRRHSLWTTNPDFCPLHRAEILTHFCSYFGRNDFISSFWNLLTFSGETFYVGQLLDYWYIRDIGTTKIFEVYEFFCNKISVVNFLMFTFCWENKKFIGQSTKIGLRSRSKQNFVKLFS